MSAQTHSNIDAGAQKTHDSIDSAATTAHNLANTNPTQRTYQAGHDATVRTQQVGQQVGQEASYRAGETLDNVSNKAYNAKENLRDGTNTAADRTRESANNVANQTRDAASTAADRTREAAGTVQAKTNEALSNAQETGRRLSTTARQQVSQLADAAAHNPLVQQTQQVSQRQLNALDRELAKYGFLNEFEARTNIPKTYGVLGLGSSAAMLILLNLFGLAQPITNLVGWALPTYLSCRALESPQSGDDKQWLTYWIIFGLLNLLESAALRVILYYIPQYFTFKLAFLVWLLYPGANNAQKVYYSLVRPLFQTGRAKANQVANSAEYGRTNTLNSPNSANYVNSSTGFSSAGTTAADSTGYSTATNPFAGQSSASSSSGYAQQQQTGATAVPVGVVYATQAGTHAGY